MSNPEALHALGIMYSSRYFWLILLALAILYALIRYMTDYPPEEEHGG